MRERVRRIRPIPATPAAGVVTLVTVRVGATPNVAARLRLAEYSVQRLIHLALAQTHYRLAGAAERQHATAVAPGQTLRRRLAPPLQRTLLADGGRAVGHRRPLSPLLAECRRGRHSIRRQVHHADVRLQFAFQQIARFQGDRVLPRGHVRRQRVARRRATVQRAVAEPAHQSAFGRLFVRVERGGRFALYSDRRLVGTTDATITSTLLAYDGRWRQCTNVSRERIC